MFKNKSLALTGAAMTALVASPFASAAIDITDATASIAEAETAVLAIGALVFGLAVAIKVYKWVRRGL
jgi:hypothetical protein